MKGIIRHQNNKTYLIIRTLFYLIAWVGAVSFLYPISTSNAKTISSPGAFPGSFSHLIKKAKPSVVNISTVRTIKGKQQGPHLGRPFGPNDPFSDFFDRFFRGQVPRDYRQKSLGSGFIIDEDGYILTNNHVVENMDEIKVKLANEMEFTAELIGRDPKTDLALIHIETDQPLTPLQMGNSDKLEVGDWVVAIGNPFGLGNTVTAGIVSSKYRNIGAGSYDNYIQTDASINPGNSGGPLLNVSGKVIGINTAIFSRDGGSIGIGFAIPINMANDLLPQLKKGKVTRGWMGVIIQKITPALKEKLRIENEDGALVSDVAIDGPAEKAGIKRGDVIISFDGKKIKEMKDLPYIVASTRINKTVQVEVIRKGKNKTFTVIVEELEDKAVSESGVEKKTNLGMMVEELTPQLARELRLPDTSGLVVLQVERNTPAAEAGLSQGDIILEIDQEKVDRIEDFNKKIRNYEKGESILLLVKRGGAALYLTIKVRE